MKTDKMADLGSLHTFVYACPLLFLSGINKVFVFYIYLWLPYRPAVNQTAAAACVGSSGGLKCG